MCVKLRPKWLKPSPFPQSIPLCRPSAGFICHPSTSELARQLMVDPESLSNENYSGLFDENGDYVPQYCDNPEDIPQGMMKPNESTGAAPESPAERGAPAQEDSPAETKTD